MLAFSTKHIRSGTMLQVQNLHKSYGADTVLAGVSFILNDREHVGLIGPNGSGKSTLLKCITGQEQPDRGAVVLSPREATIGYLPQTFAALRGQTVGDAVAGAQAKLVEAERVLQTAAES